MATIPDQITQLQAALARVGQLKNQKLELRIGEQYQALFGNNQLIRDFTSITAALLYLSTQTTRTIP
jgi:hypothetical protein